MLSIKEKINLTNEVSMETEIEKLLAQYDAKIDEVNLQLSHLKSAIREVRRSNNDYSSLRKEQAACFARNHAYMQAKSDIDSVLDYV